MVQLTFSAADYVLFCAMLIVSVIIGIYYGCFGSRQSTAKEYMFGGKSMKSFPIAMSLVASHLSGITLLGMPAEVYFHGTQLWACVLTMVFTSLIIFYVFLPVFFKLQLDSTYEYLKIRFDRRVRTLASVLFVISTLLYVPIVIYLPSLAFNQVTGISMTTIYPVICLVCIFYTSIGGLKAVVLSDTLQFCVTAGTMMAVLIMGLYYAGGLSSVWQKAEESGRIEFFNVNMDPTDRTTLWGIIFGVGATWVSHLGLNPSSIQRFLALPNYDAVKRSVIYFAIGTMVTKTISCLTGLLMYARYFDCDPLTSGRIKRSDQMLPYYVLDVVGHFPGIPGLFVAGVFCAALSTMSTCLNTLSGTIYRDFMQSRMPRDISESTVSHIMKVMVVIIGVLCTVLVLIVERLGGVLELSMSFHGITSGPLLGLFILGMLFPSSNAKGALWGGILSTLLEMILVFGKQLFIVKSGGSIPDMPLSVSGCEGVNVNSTLALLTATTSGTSGSGGESKPWGVFLISFYFYSLIGAMLVVAFGLPISWLTREEKEIPLNPDLFSPCLELFGFNREGVTNNKSLPAERYDSIDGALAKVVSGSETLGNVEKS